jgi:small-conductance mechanosensitive channel
MLRDLHGKAREMAQSRLLSIRQASELTGLRRKVIRDRVTRGDVAVRLIGSGRSAKLRLTESALVEAGLLTGPPAVAVKNDELSELIGLVREQQTRLNTLEDQRFQLAGQLGAALERTLALQNQLLELTATVQSRSPLLHEIKSVEAHAPHVASAPEPEKIQPVGSEDAETMASERPTARPAESMRHVVRVATSKGARTGKAGIARLRTIHWRSTK